MTVPPDLGPLGSLLGTWTGAGEGSYPTITPFAYRETVTFAQPPGKPFLRYEQRTLAADDGRPLHVETGYWRPVGGGRVELVLAHPTGLVEVDEGVLEPAGVGWRLMLESRTVTGTATAKPVTALRRTFELDGEELRYEVAMAAVGLDLTHHLRAVLRREAA